MGAWIETLFNIVARQLLYVAPYVGAWIETVKIDQVTTTAESHPTWVRGLKQNLKY